MVRARSSTVQSIASRVTTHASEEWKPASEPLETKHLSNPLLNKNGTQHDTQTFLGRHRALSLPLGENQSGAKGYVEENVEKELYLFPFTQREEDTLTQKYFQNFNHNSVLDYQHISKINDCYDDHLLAFQADCERNIAYFQSLLTDTTNTMDALSSLTFRYDQVVKDTEEFANQSRDLLDKQIELEKKAAEMDHVMEMFEPLETISKILSTSGTKIIKSGRWQMILAQLHEKLEFFTTHKSYKDAEVYSMRYRQCVTRTLTLMRNYNIDYLKNKTIEVSSRLSKEEFDALKLDILMYSEFGSDLDKQTDCSRFSILMQAIADQCKTHEEYQGLVSDVLSQYFKLRRTLVHFFLEKQALLLSEQHLKVREGSQAQNSNHIDIVKHCQRTISQFKRLLEKENTIFCKFFPLDNFDDSTRQFINSQLYSFMKQILEPFYDDMRNKILKETSITELSHLTNLLASYYELEDDTSSNLSMLFDKLEYGELLEPTMNDSQARLIFRIQNYIDNKLLEYKPRPQDLQLGNRKSSASRESVVDEFEDNLFPELYVPVGKALTILSNLYELINSIVFDDIAHYIVHSCIYMLKNGAMSLATSHLGQADAKLFYLKNLTMLKNHLNTFDIQFVRNETSLDLTGGIQELIRIFRSGQFSVNLNSKGGFLELVKSSAPKVINDMIDAKKEIELELTNAFNDYITDCVNMICEPILYDDDTSLKEKTTKLNDNVLMKIPHIHKQVKTYIEEDEFIAYLLNVLARLIHNTYESYHHKVENRMESSGNFNELNDIMEPDTFFNFLAETISALQDLSDLEHDSHDLKEETFLHQDLMTESGLINELERDLSLQELETTE